MNEYSGQRRGDRQAPDRRRSAREGPHALRTSDAVLDADAARALHLNYRQSNLLKRGIFVMIMLRENGTQSLTTKWLKSTVVVLTSKLSNLQK